MARSTVNPPGTLISQDTLLSRFNRMDVTREGEERRFKEQRVPWTPGIMKRAQEASLHLLVKYIRHAREMWIWICSASTQAYFELPVMTFLSRRPDVSPYAPPL